MLCYVIIKEIVYYDTFVVIMLLFSWFSFIVHFTQYFILSRGVINFKEKKLNVLCVINSKKDFVLVTSFHQMSQQMNDSFLWGQSVVCVFLFIMLNFFHFLIR